MNITSEQHQHYRDEGYLIFPGLIHGEKLAHYKGVFDGLVDRAKSMQAAQGGFVLQPDGEGEAILGR